jgi:maltose alpha-D-glucosyltransferase/alpha-amylase
VELFGRTKFPAIGALPYLLTLGPFTLHWFMLNGEPIEARLPGAGDKAAQIHVQDEWDEVFAGRPKSSLQNALPMFLQPRRWFGGKARDIQHVQVTNAIPVAGEDEAAIYLAVLKVDYFEGEAELYILPLAFAVGELAERLLQFHPERVVADLIIRQSGVAGVVYDATGEASFGQALLEMITRKRKARLNGAELAGIAAGPLTRSRNGRVQELVPNLSRYEQSNTSIAFGDRFIMKLLRRVEPGVHPDWEVGRHLTELAGFSHAPAVAGAVELRVAGQEPMLAAIVHEFVPNQGTAWQHARDALGRYFEQVLAESEQQRTLEPPPESTSLVELAAGNVPPETAERIGGYLSSAELLGTRTAEMHLALTSHPEEPGFAPEPFTQHYQRSLYQSLRKLATTTLNLLKKRLSTLPPASLEAAGAVLGREPQIHEHFQGIARGRIQTQRIRCHGDFHLGQVLFTGKDFVIIDFEGEPARTLSERRFKRSALLDVASMIRSFHYAANAAVFRHLANQAVSPDDEARLRRAAAAWYHWTSATYLKSYLATAGNAPFIPPAPEQLRSLLEVLVLEKAIYELKYELNNRPDWVEVPLRGILELLG